MAIIRVFSNVFAYGINEIERVCVIRLSTPQNTQLYCDDKMQIVRQLSTVAESLLSLCAVI